MLYILLSRKRGTYYTYAFARHELKHGMEFVHNCRRAAEAVTDYAGYDVHDVRGVSGLIENIVQTILKKLGIPIQNEEIVGTDVSSNPSQEGDDFFSSPRVQKFLLQCL